MSEPVEELRILNCPKCGKPMDPVSFRDITVDRCTGCKGLWFDALEREHLVGLANSESIDSGTTDPAVAARKATMCPVCRTQLIEMVDAKDPTLHFESCTVCYGVFYDAGEFREHKQHAEQSILAVFRNLLHRGS